MEARKRLSNPSYGPLGGYDDDNEGDPNEEFELQHQSVGPSLHSQHVKMFLSITAVPP